MTEPIIKIRNLHTSYGKRKILKGINLDIQPYETLVILGRSGCGKSTLLRHIVGLNQPDEGEIIVKGTDITKASEAAINPICSRTAFGFPPWKTMPVNVNQFRTIKTPTNPAIA